MKWVLPDDASSPIITAETHVASEHGSAAVCALPQTCVFFEMGMALPFIEANYQTVTIAQRLPCFIASSKCIALEDAPHIGFVSGGHGAPAAVDTLETIRALGVKRVIAVGMCGGFGEAIQVGDIVIPHKILSEEGTSRHYVQDAEFATPDAVLFDSAAAFLKRHTVPITDATVTTDSFYRETFAKEAYWRSLGCVGVDMECSALLTVSRYYGMPAVALMICSDKHPLFEGDEPWGWGKEGFGEARRRFVRWAVDFAVSL